MIGLVVPNLLMLTFFNLITNPVIRSPGSPMDVIRRPVALWVATRAPLNM